MAISRYIKNYDTLLASAVGFYIIYLFTRYSGIGISPDSIMYTSAARSFAAHGSTLTFNHAPIVDFPVFYPIFLGIVFFITGIDPVAAGPVLNGLMFAAVIYLSGLIMHRFSVASRLYKWLILPVIVLSAALLQVYTYLWSETLFILLCLIFFLALRQYFLKYTLGSLILVAFIAALSCVTRYAGVTVIGTGGLLLLLDRSLPTKKKINHILIYGVVSCSLLVINLLINILSTKSLTGPREPSITPFAENLHYSGTVFCDWLTLTPNQYAIASPLVWLFIFGFTSALLFNFMRKRLTTYENIAITFALVYGLFIILSATFSRFERINSRLLAPMFIPLIWGSTSWVIGIVKRLKFKPRLFVSIPLAAVMLLFAYRSYKIDWQRCYDQCDYGNPGYTDDDWNLSPFAKFLKEDKGKMFKPGVIIYSDAHEAVYFLSGTSSFLLPHKFFKKDVQKFYDTKHFYLIWFNNVYYKELLTLDDIKKVKHLKLLKQFEDGGIYEYNAADEPN
ncbi:hypothetical protein [Mucilaginibacter segetis]|uniref:Uncharacterized protein n=1 Tax=Mucilaginibacter segetis TaxID=2793071 RepID=A0A934UPJ5_9SPHI|nr:hypothetical protein [Mucilaginibacter segetis]MBK0380961.1 hypothetical protein [Mucilaginibacter segetis]